MRKNGVWQAVTSSNYSFINDEDRNLTITFDNLGASSVKIDDKILIFPTINSSFDRVIISTQNIPYSIILYDYWLGTGKANIDNRIYEFKRENITSTLCLGVDQTLIISFEEVDSFLIKYSASYCNSIDEEKSLLLCIGLFFYLKLKNNIF